MNPPVSGCVRRVSSWSVLRDEVEHKLEVGASWGSRSRPSLPGNSSEAEWQETPDPMAQNGWREIPPDPETTALWRLASPAVDILEGPSSPFEKPLWVEDFERNRRRLELSGREGAETLDAWRAQTEEKIAALLGGRPWNALHILGLLRRLPTDAAFPGEAEEEGADPGRLDAYQAEVVERAALKYAHWDGGGVELDAWGSGMTGLAQDRPAVDAERVAEVFALARLGGLHLAYLERMRRAVVRGQTVVLRPDGVSDSRPAPELRRRLDLYDERRRRFSFLGETASLFAPSPLDAAAASEPSLFHVVRTTYREDEGGDFWRYQASRRLIRKRDKRFVFTVADLGPAYEYLKLLEDEVAAQYGLSPELIVSALSALEMAMVGFLSPDGTEAFLPERLAYLDKRGYLIVHNETMDQAVLGLLTAEAYRRAFPDIPLPEGDEGFAQSFKRLAYLDSYRRDDLRLEDGKPWVRRSGLDKPVPMPPPFVYPAGDYRIVDLNAVGDFLQGIVDCLILEEAPRQRVSKSLEQRSGDYFDRELNHSRAFEPSKELRTQPPGQRSRVVVELDVSVKIGSVLVAVDAKSIQISPGYRGYAHADLRNRWQKFERYVEQADKLAQQTSGTNYDLLAEGYTHVVTLLCSTVPEFVDTDDPNFFVTGNVPRVATPPELRDYLAETSEEELKTLPFAKRIRAE